MKSITVCVSIESGNIWVDIDITDKEYKDLSAAIEADENGESEYEFSENPKLAKLYAKIIDAALDEAANGAMDSPLPELGEVDFETNRNYIQENYRLWADYGDVSLDGDIWE